MTLATAILSMIFIVYHEVIDALQVKRGTLIRIETYDLCYIELGDMPGILILRIMRKNEKNIILKFEILPLSVP